MSLLLEIGIKSIGLLGLTSVIAFILRRSSASLRHRIWALSFLGLAALPLLSLRLPEIPVERPAISYYSPIVAAKPSPVLPATRKSPALSSNGPEVPERRNWSDLLPTLLIAIWGSVAAALLIRLAYQLFRLCRLTKGGELLPLEAPRRTRVLRSGATHVPMTFGVLHPTILLPPDSKNWQEDRLRAVLLHESAHVTRRDWAWLILCRLIAAVYWPNPLVFWAMLRLRAETELAADDMVLRQGVDAPNYAATLVDLAEGLRSRSAVAALPFVEAGSLQSRVKSILLNSASRKPSWASGCGRRSCVRNRSHHPICCHPPGFSPCEGNGKRCSGVGDRGDHPDGGREGHFLGYAGGTSSPHVRDPNG